MKITFICLEKKESSGSHGGPLYSYKFGVKKVSDNMAIQRTAGEFSIHSIEPLHYKYKEEVEIIISSSGIVIPSSIGDN